MARLNKATKKNVIYTHEGAKAKHINAEFQLRRSVMACLLWEDQFYEDGESIADRIAKTIPKVEPQKVADIAIEAREKMKLRHAPLLIVREMARLPKHKVLVAKTLSRIIQRADELTEFLAIYWKDGRQPLSAQVKKGLAWAFPKFDSYQLAKYNRKEEIKLRDVMFLSHPKPKDKEQEIVWKKLIDGKLEPPDTWEVALSTGKDKKETWERLLRENKLGALALLRNLRNFQRDGVNEDLVIKGLDKMNVSRVLPFRFIAAARHAPQWENYIEEAMMKCIKEKEKFPGTTMLLVDVSGSMQARLSGKSDMNRIDVACGLGVILKELCEKVMIFSFSDYVKTIPPRKGFALRDAIYNSQEHMGTYLGEAIKKVNKYKYDRLIVITDEQSHDVVPNPNGRGYMINVASYQNGVGYGAWLHIDGWSEAIIDYIREYEKLE